MANLAEPITCGVDVSLASLEIAISEKERLQIPNSARHIQAWLNELPVNTRLAIEATSNYHEILLDLALKSGLEVYIINGKQLRHYREAVGPRAKTDRDDALLLRRYLRAEYEHLRPVKSLNDKQKRLWRLLKRRAMLVKVRRQLRLSMKSDAEVEVLTRDIVKKLEQVIRKVELLMRTTASEQGWDKELQHCQSVPGIGPVNALALVACFHRGSFSRADQFVAYIGLDVRVRDSGRMSGKRKLSKRGEPEMRRLLYNAAMTFARSKAHRLQYERMRARGLSTTAAHVAMSRKLARIAFALMRKGEDYSMKA